MSNKFDVDAIAEILQFYDECFCCDIGSPDLDAISLHTKANAQLEELLNAVQVSDEEDPGRICD